VGRGKLMMNGLAISCCCQVEAELPFPFPQKNIAEFFYGLFGSKKSWDNLKNKGFVQQM